MRKIWSTDFVKNVRKKLKIMHQNVMNVEAKIWVLSIIVDWSFQIGRVQSFVFCLTLLPKLLSVIFRLFRSNSQ